MLPEAEHATPPFSPVPVETASELGQPLAEIVAATLSAAGRSDATRRSYQTAIGQFLQYLDYACSDSLPPELAQRWRPFAEAGVEGKRTVWTYRVQAGVLRLTSAAVLDGFRTWREGQGDSANSASQRVYAVRTFLSIAYRDGILSVEQAQALGLRRYQQRQKVDRAPVGRRLSPAEVRALREVVDTTTVKGRRDLAILDTMLFLGLRREEVAGLSLAGFRQDGGRWWLVLQGKGQKTRRLKVHDTLFQSLSAWVSSIDASLGGDGPLFRSFDRGDRVTARGIDASLIGRLVAAYGDAALLAPAKGKNRLSAHDLRRTCARNAFDNGASLLS